MSGPEQYLECPPLEARSRWPMTFSLVLAMTAGRRRTGDGDERPIGRTPYVRSRAVRHRVVLNLTAPLCARPHRRRCSSRLSWSFMCDV